VTDVDPGFHYFRDYYRQFTSVAEAREFLAVGTVIALDPPYPKNFLVTALHEDTFDAVTINDPKEEITAKYSDVVFPENILYVLEFDSDTNDAAINAVIVRRLNNES
jgi:hypothetical protein